jgi:hypothetical protein
MNRNSTPVSLVPVTDAGMVIEIKSGAVQSFGGVRAPAKKGIWTVQTAGGVAFIHPII